MLALEVFPARGEITEAVDRNAFQLLIAATAVGGGEDFDLQSRGALPSQQLDECRKSSRERADREQPKPDFEERDVVKSVGDRDRFVDAWNVERNDQSIFPG